MQCIFNLLKTQVKSSKNSRTQVKTQELNFKVNNVEKNHYTKQKNIQ